MKASYQSLDLRGERVLVREDLNVPLQTRLSPKTSAEGAAAEHSQPAGDDRIISDDSRLRAALGTLRDLSHRGARVIVMSHLGRPKGRRVPELSLRPVARRLAELLEQPVAFADDCVGPLAEEAVARLGEGDVLVLENVRFHRGDEDNDPEFARELAALGDVYVNDAFAASHRAHASVVGVAAHLPAYAGILMLAELEALHRALDEPRRPLVAIVAGAKVSTKAGVLRFLLPKVDSLLLGGAMANTFFKAEGKEVGASLVEDEALDTAREVQRQGAGKLELPVDAVCARAAQPGQDTILLPVDGVDDGWMMLDAGPATVRHFAERLHGAGTVVWNGPVGVFEIPEFSEGTRGVGEAVADSGAYSLVGGGDTAAAVAALGLTGRFSHVSTGGGATLEYMEGRELPGVAVLRDRV
ncbi:MAG TPA: phosphoglycerate kinase [Candidatus Dormibacteraeota bacterium]|nr:phosphoglycerate kinase [Candidatus Dormibacteraeota bacterium]